MVRRGVCGAVLLMALLGVVGGGNHQDVGGYQDGMQDVVSAYQDGGGQDDPGNDW